MELERVITIVKHPLFSRVLLSGNSDVLGGPEFADLHVNGKEIAEVRQYLNDRKALEITKLDLALAHQYGYVDGVFQNFTKFLDLLRSISVFERLTSPKKMAEHTSFLKKTLAELKDEEYPPDLLAGLIRGANEVLKE